MRVYPPGLAAHALAGRVLMVWGAAWFRRMVDEGVAKLSPHMPPTLVEGVAGVAPLPEVVPCASLDDLAKLTAAHGAYEARKSRCILVGDGDREAQAQLDLLERRAREGWPVLLSANTFAPAVQRFAGHKNVQVWPFASIEELAFRASQL
ncbi:MAG: hypothetical protein U0271_11535 [Polyangiaceae bacterium]